MDNLYPSPKLNNMRHWVGFFLQGLRRSFPDVYLTDTDGEASTQRRDWGDDMHKFEGRDAGVMNFNRVIMENTIRARDQDSDEARQNLVRFRFLMGISVAHEICHLLMGFFTGEGQPLTPRKICLVGYNEGKKGEAGRVFEGEVFGGVVEFYQDKNDPLGVYQAGIPYLIEDGRGNVPAKRVCPSYMEDFVNRREFYGSPNNRVSSA